MEVSNKLLQNIFISQSAQLQKLRHPLKNLKAIDAISQCRTKEMGASYYSCKDSHSVIEQPHSCRHRSCYLCAQGSRLKWIEAQKKRLFNCSHFHVIFTVPHEYLSLWQYNEKWFTQTLFRVANETLQSLIKDKKYHGITPGIMIALHTWGRQLNLHPHVHCLITAGGLDTGEKWQPINQYLLPIKVVKALYRGKFQAAIDEAYQNKQLKLPADMNERTFRRAFKTAYRKEWSVRIEEKYEHGKGVMLYLARYLKGGPMNPAQIQSCDANKVVFKYKDHRQNRIAELSLETRELVRRLLIHVPVIGAHTVRYYGLYSSSAKRKRELCRDRLGDLSSEELGDSENAHDMILFCKTCGKQAYLIQRVFRRGRKGNSLIERKTRATAQQGDEAHPAHEFRTRDPCEIGV